MLAQRCCPVEEVKQAEQEGLAARGPEAEHLALLAVEVHLRGLMS
jgi:hypothetical protein